VLSCVATCCSYDCSTVLWLLRVSEANKSPPFSINSLLTQFSIVLIEYQHLPLVLFRDHHGIENKCIRRRSMHSIEQSEI